MIDRPRSKVPWVRDWAPLGYILAGYFLSGYLFASPSVADRVVADGVGSPAARRSGDAIRRRGRGALVAGLELIYMGCFLLIPAGAALLLLAGHCNP